MARKVKRGKKATERNAAKVGKSHATFEESRTASTRATILNAEVNQALKRAVEESDIGGNHPTEQGGFILRDPTTGALSVQRWPAGAGDSMSPPISTDGKWNHQEIIGSFHTHPNVGKGWRQRPSDADIDFVKNYPKTAGQAHFVIGKNQVYAIDNEGKVSTVGRTSELLP